MKISKIEAYGVYVTLASFSPIFMSLGFSIWIVRDIWVGLSFILIGIGMVLFAIIGYAKSMALRCAVQLSLAIYFFGMAFMIATGLIVFIRSQEIWLALFCLLVTIISFLSSKFLFKKFKENFEGTH